MTLANQPMVWYFKQLKEAVKYKLKFKMPSGMDSKILNWNHFIRYKIICYKIYTRLNRYWPSLSGPGKISLPHLITIASPFWTTASPTSIVFELYHPSPQTKKKKKSTREKVRNIREKYTLMWIFYWERNDHKCSLNIINRYIIYQHREMMKHKELEFA